MIVCTLVQIRELDEDETNLVHSDVGNFHDVSVSIAQLSIIPYVN